METEHRGRRLRVYQKPTDLDKTPFPAVIVGERITYWLADYRNKKGEIVRGQFLKAACTLLPKGKKA